MVAKCFIQEYGIDYEKAFAPVTRITSIRSLIDVVAIHKGQLYQMDVKMSSLMMIVSSKFI